MVIPFWGCYTKLIWPTCIEGGGHRTVGDVAYLHNQDESEHSDIADILPVCISKKSPTCLICHIPYQEEYNYSNVGDITSIT